MKASNKPTAELRIAILKYVMEFNYYPSEWMDINELEEKCRNDEIGYEEYDRELEKIRKTFFQYCFKFFQEDK
jgi:hypothetical protein